MDTVTAIVLNWQGRNVIGPCLESLRKQTYPDLKVVVVDNASTDGSVGLIEKRFPWVDLRVNAANLGFGGGNNVGIGLARGPYVLMVNNDTVLMPDCVERLVDVMKEHPEAGACATRIVLKETPGVIDAAGISVCPDGLSLGRGRMGEASRYQEAQEVFFASDCCCLYRRAMLESVCIGNEVYDVDFFAYADETDLGWRAQRAGWKTIYVPDAVVYHCHSASTGSHSPFKAYLVERNRIWVAVKNFPLWLLAFGFCYTVVRYFWQAYGAFFGKGRSGAFRKDYGAGKLALILLKAYADALAGLGRMIRKRRKIMRIGTMAFGDVCRIFREFGISARDVALRG